VRVTSRNNFFFTDRSSGLAERDPQLNFDKNKIGLRSAFVSPPSLYFSLGAWGFASPGGQKSFAREYSATTQGLNRE
jgi:hypothetical protein